MADVKQKKARIIKNVKKTGTINKKDITQPKAYRNEYDTLAAYNDEDVVFEYNDVPYTQGYFTQGNFPNIEYFIKPNMEPQVKEIKDDEGNVVETYPILDLHGNPVIVMKGPKKANNSDKKSRHLPVGWILLKLKGNEGVFCVNPEIFFTNPMVSIRQGKLFKDDYDYVRSYTIQDLPYMFRILINTPEFTGVSGSKKNTWGNKFVNKLRALTDEQIFKLKTRVDRLHKWILIRDKLKDKINSGVYTDEDEQNYIKYYHLVDGENEQIMMDFNLGKNRGILTDFRVWIMLLSCGKNVPLTENSKYEGVFVIPNILSFVFVEKMTNKRLEQVWKEV